MKKIMDLICFFEGGNALIKKGTNAK